MTTPDQISDAKLPGRRQTVSAAEFSKLLVSTRDLDHTVDHEHGVRILTDRTTGEVFEALTQQVANLGVPSVRKGL